METTAPAADTTPVEPAIAAATPPQAAPPATKPPPSKVAAATVEDGDGDGDDSDDDLDDLDDMLDEFDDGSAGAKAATGSGKAGEPVIDEEWARMLQEGMADLLSDVNQSPEMQGQFEKLAKELNEVMAGDATSTSAAPPAVAPAAAAAAAAADPKAADNFQERIKATMDRMKSSNAEVDAGLADADSDDFLAEMLKTMGGAGGDGEEDFSTMLVTMMEQLTSKEILYEPMKELYEKYPEWMRKNEAKESKDDMARYRAQFAIVKEIVNKFDEPGYKDEDESCREYIVERMQKMQTAGAPPQELMGDVGQGLDPPDVPSDCGVQ